jgi:hypothetical protein
MIVLKNFDFERKNKTNSYRSSEESSRWKKVPLEAIKKVRYVVFQNIKVICKKNYGFQHFGNFLTDPRSPANKFFRTGLTYLASTPCEAILNQST